MPELAEIIDALPLPALVVDRRDRLLAANAEALALLPAGALGRPLALAIRAADLLAGVAEVMAGGPPRELRIRLAREGAEHVYAAKLTGLGDDAMRQVLCTFHDISAEEVAEAMRRDFVANVSHELRTPLTALSGFIETLQGPARDDPAARERFLGIMAREAGRMNRLVRDLLQLSRVEAEERVRPRDAIDLVGLLASVRSTLRPVAEELHSTVRIDAPEGPIQVPGDHDQLVQVFSNLIENALKYGAPAQEVRVTVRREAGRRGPMIRVEVADRGEGIDPVHLPRLTERFYRVDSHRSRAKGGTGLGLAIVKHIVARHRGALKIESVKGEGSTFSVILPEG